MEFSSNDLKNSKMTAMTYLGFRRRSPSFFASLPSSIGWVDLLMISLKMSNISFWKIIDSPERTRFVGANSVSN